MPVTPEHRTRVLDHLERQARVLPIARLVDINRPIVKQPAGPVPWRIVTGTDASAVLDANGNTLFIATAPIAGRIVAAVNMVECAQRGER